MEAVKLVDVEKGLIEGFAIPFGGPMAGGKDLDGEAFTKDTELYLDAYGQASAMLYHHGIDKAMGTAPIGPLAANGNSETAGYGSSPRLI